MYGLTLTGHPKALGLMIADLRGLMEMFEFKALQFWKFCPMRFDKSIAARLVMGADTKPRSLSLQIPPLNISCIPSLLLWYDPYDNGSQQGYGKVQRFSAYFG